MTNMVLFCTTIDGATVFVMNIVPLDVIVTGSSVLKVGIDTSARLDVDSSSQIFTL